MRPLKLPRSAALAALGFGLLLPYAAPTWAHLGGSADSVEMDRQAIHGAAVATTSLQQYGVKEITSATGTVREYLSPTGTVFAVTWHGSRPPNLQQLFNGYFAGYQTSTAALAGNPGARRHVSVQTSDLVVDSMAYLRTYRGFAYVPALLPAGVTPANLQ